MAAPTPREPLLTSATRPWNWLKSPAFQGEGNVNEG